MKTVLAARDSQHLICDTDDITGVAVLAVTRPKWPQEKPGTVKVTLTFDETTPPQWIPATRTSHLITSEAVYALWEALPADVRNGRRAEDVAEWAETVLDATWRAECGGA